MTDDVTDGVTSDDTPPERMYVYHVAYRTNVAKALPPSSTLFGWSTNPGVLQERYGDMTVALPFRVVIGNTYVQLRTRVRQGFVEHYGVEPDGVFVLTSVTLLATPGDQLDDQEWRRERDVAQLARDVAYAWSQVGQPDRTHLGEYSGQDHASLANALDALTGAVNRPVTP